jgi:hypothetical protein
MHGVTCYFLRLQMFDSGSTHLFRGTQAPVFGNLQLNLQSQSSEIMDLWEHFPQL